MKKICALFTVLVLAGISAPAAEPAAEPAPPPANDLGMCFVLLPGTAVQFSIYETRVRDFRAFVRATGYVHMRESSEDARMITMDTDGTKPRGHSWENPGFDQTEDHPVVGVNWRDAKAFCEWLTLRERAAGRLSAEREYRLPTDHEWSLAVGLEAEKPDAKPKDKSEKTYQYPWDPSGKWDGKSTPPNAAGNIAGDEVNNTHLPPSVPTFKGYSYRDDYPRTAPVGSFPANRLRIFDLAGNVSEWCEDEFDAKEGTRVLRGSSWLNYEPRKLLSSFRRGEQPSRRNAIYGFRCVIAPALP